LYSTTRSFISPNSFHIFNCLCDSLVLLALTYSTWYPDHPFCPWVLGTEFVEHFFGLARMLLPNFTYAELLKMVQNVMVRQKLLLMGEFREGREKESAAGYSFDYDPYPITAAQLQKLHVHLMLQDLNSIVEVAYQDVAQICKDILRIQIPALEDGQPLFLTPLGVPKSKIATGKRSARRTNDLEDLESGIDSADESGDNLVEDIQNLPLVDPAQAMCKVVRLSQLSDDLGSGIEQVAAAVNKPMLTVIQAVLSHSESPPSKPILISAPTPSIVVTSTIMDDNNRVSISLMLKSRLLQQSKATVRSERVVNLDPRFASVHRTISGVDKESKMTVQEASHRVRIAQVFDGEFVQAKKDRELRWQNVARAIAQLVMPQGLLDVVLSS
jgi:hypothetical protein